MKIALLYTLSCLCVLALSACSSDSDQNRDALSSESVTSDGAASIPAEPDQAVTTSEEESMRIVFLGDSITAGYGIDSEEAFPALVEERLQEQGYQVSIVDAGVSGDTSTGGLNRIDWLLRNPIDILILELGGNDGLRGVDLRVTRASLAGIIEKTQAAYPDSRIVLAGMQVPPNLGHDYAEEFRALYSELAQEYETDLIPFVLEGVGGDPRYNQSDGIHPTEEGHVIIAEVVLQVLEPIVREELTAAATAPSTR